MDIILLFERVFGLYLIITGILALSRQHEIVSVARLIGKDKPLRYSIGALITLGGLFMAISFYDWSTLPTTIITLVGWLVLLKGLVMLYSPDGKLNRTFMALGSGWWYRAWGVIALVAGGYLALLGFGLM